MKTMIAYCGLTCSECPAFLARLNDNNDLRVKTAKEWSKMFKADLKPEDINCVGCLEKEGPLFSHCSDCNIRACCIEKEVANCAHCGDYSCEKIEEFFKMAPEVKKKLDEIRDTL